MYWKTYKLSQLVFLLYDVLAHSNEGVPNLRIAQCETNLYTVAYAYLVQEEMCTQEPASHCLPPNALNRPISAEVNNGIFGDTIVL